MVSLEDCNFTNLVSEIVAQIYFMLNLHLDLWVSLLGDMDKRGSPWHSSCVPCCGLCMHVCEAGILCLLDNDD